MDMGLDKKRWHLLGVCLETGIEARCLDAFPYWELLGQGYSVRTTESATL